MIDDSERTCLTKKEDSIETEAMNYLRKILLYYAVRILDQVLSYFNFVIRQQTVKELFYNVEIKRELSENAVKVEITITIPHGVFEDKKQIKNILRAIRVRNINEVIHSLKQNWRILAKGVDIEADNNSS